MAYEKENMKVEIVSTKFIKPSSPTPNHLQNYKLSFFDQIADEAHLPLVLFYPPTNNINYASHEQQIEQSLSRILSHVYPMAGRFNEDIDSIYCQDQGVKFIKAKVNGKLINEFLEKAHKDVNLALLCWPQDTWDVDDTNLSVMPIVIVQITELECGGLALSVSHAHTAMDGFTIFNTIYEWDLSKLLLPSAPEEDRVEANLVEKRLYINENSISRLREEVGDLCFKPSRVEMIIALLWRALIRASEKNHGHLRRSLIGVPINLRPSPEEWEGSPEEVDMFASSSLCRFPIQEVDFGWGKPCLMHFGSRHNQVCWLYDAECGNGICVQVELKEEIVKLFECEDDIKNFFEF
ncbi:hypothetical protein BC332_31276 [Capsicum chinense]|nr:hypothetical protein BC332_31276 [Capsicum chinense]